MPKLATTKFDINNVNWSEYCKKLFEILILRKDMIYLINQDSI